MDKGQFAILRFAKYKGPEISNIDAHNERTKEKYARLSGYEHLPPVSVPFRRFLSRLTCWAASPAAFVGRKNRSKNPSSQVLCSFR